MSSSIPCQLPLFPEKVCTKCGRSKPLDDFYVNNKRTGRRFNCCKDCHNAAKRAKYATDEATRDRYKAQATSWQKAHPEKVLENARRSYQRNRDEVLERERARNATPESQAKRRAYREANADRIKAYNAQYRNTPEYKEKRRQARKESDARWRKKHKSEIDAYNAAYRETHREQMAEAARRSREKKLEHYNALSRAWKATHPQERISHTHKRRALLRGMGGVVSAFEWERIKAQHDWRCVDCGRQEKTEGITLCRDHIIPLRPGFNIAANIAPRCKQCNSKKHRRLLKRREG